MEGVTSYREAQKARLRESLVAAARELTVAHGWDTVRMVDVAGRAGVSRQTVYNEFGGRPGLAEALAGAEIQRFVVAVREDLFAHGADTRAAVRAAVLHVLTEAAVNPLVRGMLTAERGDVDELLPFLTTRSEVVLAAAGEVIGQWLGRHRPDLDAGRATLATESIIRLTMSHIVLPTVGPRESAEALAEVFVRIVS